MPSGINSSDSRGMTELKTGRSMPIGKIRKSGCGRKKLENVHGDLLLKIEN